MTAKTRAEIQRAYRERQKDSGDRVRDFLTGVIEDANRAVAAGDCPPWLLARSASAIEVLDDLGQVAEERPPLLLNMIALSMEARTAEEKAAALAQHEREFEKWLQANAPVRSKMAKTGAVLAHNVRILEWAQEARLGGRSTAASLTQGLNAAKRLVRVREKQGTAAQFRLFSGPRQIEALGKISRGDIGGRNP